MRLDVGITCASIALLVAACGGSSPEPATPSAPPSPTSTAPAEAEGGAAEAPRTIEIPLEAKSGSSLRGTASFTPAEGGVRVVVDVSGVTPGLHAVHIHETGDCNTPDAMSAGGHFNPEDHPHGLPESEERHLGDFGNMDVKEDGTGRLEILAPRATLEPGGQLSFLGRSIIVHAKPDTGEQPVGGAGERIGCGVIQPSGG